MTVVLPPHLISRAPTMDDLQAITDMLVAWDMTEYGMSDSTTDQLRAEWGNPGFTLATDARVVVAPGGRIVGYIQIQQLTTDGVITTDGYVYPASADQGIGTYQLRWAEARIRQALAQVRPATSVSVHATINGASSAAHELFQAEGYAPVRHFWQMEIALHEPPPAPAWPVEISVRAFVPGQDDRTTHAVMEEAFADHWGHVYTPFEEWARVRIQRENFDPDLWFLAQDGAEIAGAAICYNRADMGWIRGLGVRSGWRRQGLGMALLLHAFAAFYQRGQKQIGLGVDAHSLTGATRLYERAGMHVTRRYDTYGKELRVGDEQ